jgi:hypothetical protein
MMKLIRFIKRYCYAFIYCVYLFLFGFLSSKNRSLIDAICRYFGYRTCAPILPVVFPDSVIDTAATVLLDYPGVKDGGVSCLDLVCIVHLLKKSDAKNIFEIGTFTGCTTANLAANSIDGSIVYTIDLPQAMLNSTKWRLDKADKNYVDKEDSGSFYKNKDSATKIKQLLGDTAKFDFGPFYGQVDFVFVDGAHSYEYVINDSLVAFKLAKRRKSIIVWHDYNGSWDGVTQALNELYLSRPEFKGLKHVQDTSLAFLVL